MPNGFHEDPQAAQERREREQKAEQDRRAAAEQMVDENINARDQLNAEYFERSEGVKPSPTQRECDLLKLGVPLDEREPSGAEPEHEAVRRVMEARLPHNNPYESRAIGAGESSGDRAVPRRGPGRPRRSEQQPPTE